MIYKYAELNYRYTLYNACRGILRTKIAESRYPGIYKEAADPEYLDLYLKGVEAWKKYREAMMLKGYKPYDPEESMKGKSRAALDRKAAHDAIMSGYDADTTGYLNIYKRFYKDPAYIAAVKAKEEEAKKLAEIERVRALAGDSRGPIYINTGKYGTAGTGNVGGRSRVYNNMLSSGGSYYDPRSGMWYEYDESTGEMEPVGGGSGSYGRITMVPGPSGPMFLDEFGEVIPGMTMEKYKALKLKDRSRERAAADADERYAESEGGGEGEGRTTTEGSSEGTGSGSGGPKKPMIDTDGDGVPDTEVEFEGPTGDPLGDYGKEYEMYSPEKVNRLREAYIRKMSDQLEANRVSGRGTIGRYGGGALGALAGGFGGWHLGGLAADHFGLKGGARTAANVIGAGAVGTLGLLAGAHYGHMAGKAYSRYHKPKIRTTSGRKVKGKSYYDRQRDLAGAVFDDMIKNKYEKDLNTHIKLTDKDLKFDKDLYDRRRREYKL